MYWMIESEDEDFLASGDDLYREPELTVGKLYDLIDDFYTNTMIDEHNDVIGKEYILNIIDGGQLYIQAYKSNNWNANYIDTNKQGTQLMAQEIEGLLKNNIYEIDKQFLDNLKQLWDEKH